MRPIVLALGVLFLFRTASAATLHVPADYPTIQQAINAATSGDVVLVTAGTYHETISINVAQDGIKVDSESGSAVTIIDGGYTGSVVRFSGVGAGTELVGFTITHGGHNPASVFDGGGGILANNASPKIDSDVITDCMGAMGAGIVVGGPATITNCVIQNNICVEIPTFNGAGGGIYVGGSPTIANNTIKNNQALGTSRGAGIYVGGGSPDIENNVIQGNQNDGIYWSSPNGGTVKANQFISNAPGMYVFTGFCCPTPTVPPILGNLFQSNSVSGLWVAESPIGLVEGNQFIGNAGGAALFIDDASTGDYRGNLFQDNENLSGPGGAIRISDHPGNAIVEQNVILRNHSGTYGGGIYVSQGTEIIRSNTIALNRADLRGGNLCVQNQSSVTLLQNVLSHSPNEGLQRDNATSTITMSCNDLSGNAGGNYSGLADQTGLNGNISLDPLYCNLSALDVHLASTSPCVAANSPAGCGLIGALDVSCEGPVRTEPSTWGAVKARYR